MKEKPTDQNYAHKRSMKSKIKQVSKICLTHAYFLTKYEPEYTYKRYSYKKQQHVI